MNGKLIASIVLIVSIVTVSIMSAPILSNMWVQVPPANHTPATYTPLAVWFGEQHSTELQHVGGKGASLSTLASVPGIQVPEGFIITTEAYKQAIGGNQFIQQELLKLDHLSDIYLSIQLNPNKAHHIDIAALEQSILEQATRIRGLLLKSTLPASVQTTLINEYQALCQQLDQDTLPVAVRSSATAEDLPNASFAGQHDSFLNQIGHHQVVDSVIACWASLFHPHTVLYRNQARLTLLQQNGIMEIDPSHPSPGDRLKHSHVALAVVVQRLIQAQSAGVGFNVNPMGEPHIHIEASTLCSLY